MHVSAEHEFSVWGDKKERRRTRRAFGCKQTCAWNGMKPGIFLSSFLSLLLVAINNAFVSEPWQIPRILQFPHHPSQ